MDSGAALLLALADRCAKAPGADRLLDADICVGALGFVETLSPEGDWRTFETPQDERANLRRDGETATDNIPRLTASLDAAMTLYLRVPDRVPSNPRLAAADALRQRAAAQPSEEMDDGRQMGAGC